ncbi:restriction endonuclease subunit S [Pseudomonas schmalbachii]|uniref:Restriction endonuclease subunit S n=1 Tax=Pseudomonas schmalbachii TaxID=2816993 RepID=A0ABS3TNG6_9PSED|nr:restriction endonuclease subunit S [Pseudomonas schmalbachii]MBO3274109.1 restriction endonuclease subunit S [Pseudomonas schmalbachii]
MGSDFGRFGDLFSEPQRNGLTRPKKVRGVGFPMVNMGELFAHYRIRDLEMDLVPVSEKEQQFFLQDGDLLFARQSLVLAGAGQCSIFLGNKTATVFESHLIRCRLDQEKYNPHFYFYFFRSPDGRRAIEAIVEQGAGASGIRGSDLVNVQVPIPAKRYQDQAAGLLAEIDDRISLLRETNATLEAIAQTLFKSWFVDFDPVRAKAEGRPPEGMDAATAALFPDSFEESELGLVPKGWKVLPLGDICCVTIGGLWGNDDSGDSDLVPAISLRGVDLEHLRVNGFSKDAPVRWVKPAAMEKRRLSDKEVLVAASGAGPCGRPLWAGAPFEAIYGRPVIFSNFVKRLECGTAARAIYVDRLLAEMRKSEEIWNFINGTSVPNLDDKLLLSTKKIILPSNDVLSVFADIAIKIYDKIYDQKAQTLTRLRDTLLPRLISGQLLLPDAKTMVEAAG